MNILVCLQVPLGVLLKSEIKHEDMVDIMEHYQNYVPTRSSEAEYHDPDSDDIVKLHIDHFHHLLFVGDQLTAERAQGAKNIRSNAERGTERFKGLQPVIADWHAKVAQLKVSV